MRASTASLLTATALGAALVLTGCSGNVADTGDEVSGALAGEMAIFGSRTPKTPSDSDAASVELGLKFRSTAAGAVTGVRFYKSKRNTGTHTGHLWSASGQSLGAVTFGAESASGWQLARFASPIAIKANTVYVVSYHASHGHYAGDENGLAQAFTMGPLTALEDGDTGGNGVYAYGSSTAFPTQSWNASNYYVDILFVAAGSPPPADAGTPPRTDAGTPPRTDAGTPPRTDAGTPPRTDAGTPPVVGAGYPYPSASNTGVPAGTTLTPSGTITITRDGTVIDALDISGCVYVQANNVTIKRTRVRGGCYETIHIEQPYSNLVVEDSELDGLRDCGENIGYSNYTIRRSNMHGCSDGPRISENAKVIIQDCYIHDLAALPGDHGDGIQSYGAEGPAVIQHNTILAGTGGTVNSAVFTADYSSGTYLVDDNVLQGGGYTLRVYDNTATVTNNCIVAGSWGYAPVDVFRAPGASDPGATIVAWSGNHVCANADGTGVGAVINEP